MKRNKKTMMALSFGLGALMLATTAFADIASKTGYEQLKDAVKFTSQNMEGKLQTFTIEGTVLLKDNDTVLVTNSFTQKIDTAKNAEENVSSLEYSNGKKSNTYQYRDNSSIISYNHDNDTYYVTEYAGSSSNKVYKDAFKEDRVNDMEKIFDAVIGNLREYVVVEEKSDGSKEFSGALSETQIPAIVNAVSSFAFKQAFSRQNPMEQEIGFPQIANDAFVKKVTGRANVNKDGIIDSVLATGILSGKDKEGNNHDLTLEVLGKVNEINSTSVAKPELANKKVEKHVQPAFEDSVTKKFIGKYRNEIVTVENDTFIKIGERIVEIVSIDDKHVSGRYYEQYKDGYAKDSGNNEFTFDAEIKNGNFAEFEFKDSSGKSQKGGNISFDQMSGRIYFHTPSLGQGKFRMYDSGFSRIFE